MKSTKLFFVMLIMGLMIISCGDDDTLESNESKDVNVKFQMNVDQEALVHETTYNINGTDVQFTNVAFYLGDMKFETSDGMTYESSDRYQLIKPGIFDFNFSIPATEEDVDVNLSKITFFVGVDAETNAEIEMDFTERPEGDVLGQQNPTMHWGWAGGYRFLNIDGNADTDGDGEFETQLTYHLGFDEFLKNISLSPDQLLEEGANEFKINFDMSTFLAGVDFATENFTKVQPDNRTIADKLFDNYSSSITFVK